MNDSELLLKLAEADSYSGEAALPEEIWTADLALREIERRIGMSQEKTRVPDRKTSATRTGQAAPMRARPAAFGRGIWIGVAAAALVVVAGALLLFRSEEGLIAGEPPGPLDAYVTALRANDSQAALAALSEDVLPGFTPWLVGSDTSGIEVTECEIRDAVRRLVVCQVDMGPAFFQTQIGGGRDTTLLASLDDSTMELIDMPNPDSNASRAFRDWVAEFHPDRYGELFDDSGIDGTVWTEEAGRLQFEFLDEYLDYLATQG